MYECVCMYVFKYVAPRRAPWHEHSCHMYVCMYACIGAFFCAEALKERFNYVHAHIMCVTHIMCVSTYLYAHKHIHMGVCVRMGIHRIWTVSMHFRWDQVICVFTDDEKWQSVQTSVACSCHMYECIHVRCMYLRVMYVSIFVHEQWQNMTLA
jgi:hypothetical protein